VAWTEAYDGYWLVTGYDAIREISRHDDLFSSDHDPERVRQGFTGVTVPPTYPLRLGFIEMDAPEHTEMRKALLSWFNQRAVEAWRSSVEDITTAFIDMVIEEGECDLIYSVASPVPAVVTMTLLGAPLDRWRLWSDANHRTVAAGPSGPERDRAIQEMQEVMGDMAHAIAARRAEPEAGEPTNLISVLCRMERDGQPLTTEEILLHCVLIAAGGIDTTTSSIATALKWLAENPEERRRLCTGGPELMKTAVEEFLRISAPVTALARTATCPYDLGGQRVEEGERLLMVYAAANYDPAAFPDPETVDLARSPNPHTSFGLSGHRCIGMHFARLELEVVITEVLKRMPGYSLDHARALRSPDVGVNQGWLEMPIRFTPGSRQGSKFDPTVVS
jgi:cytochrome P450